MGEIFANKKGQFVFASKVREKDRREERIPMGAGETTCGDRPAPTDEPAGDKNDSHESPAPTDQTQAGTASLPPIPADT